MSTTDTLITLVVHTADRAAKLKEALESHKIQVVLERVDVSIHDTDIYKVRIPVDSLALGLKILESGDLNSAPLAVMKITGMGNSMLIPVDFSQASMRAVKIGFYLAQKFEIEPILLHAYLQPLYNSPNPFGGALEESDVQGAELDADLQNIAETQFDRFIETICSNQKSGALPDIKFSTRLLEGVPEQVIGDFCRSENPLMAVMATRDIAKKGSELVGSVTAEVIDSCRLPVLTVPDIKLDSNVDEVRRIVLFCNLTRFDIVTMRGLMRTFNYPSCQFFLIPVSERPLVVPEHRIEQLRDYFSRIYPTAEFHVPELKGKNFDDSVRDILDHHKIQLIIVPNKKSSAISRFFRPTLAHKILFEKDIPLLALPV